MIRAIHCLDAIDSIADISMLESGGTSDQLTCKYGCSAAAFFRSTFNAVRIGPGMIDSGNFERWNESADNN
jgi:hypothetical protein